MLTRVPIVLITALVCGVLAAAPAGGVSAQGPKRGGTLVVGRPSFTEPECLNPLSCGGGDLALAQVLEGAFEVGPDLVLRPDLVTRVTTGRNPPSLTYYIRPEARWSDGAPVTARDFQFTHEVFAAHNQDLSGFDGNVLRTRVINPKTFWVELRRPFAAWRFLYPLVLPRHALVGQDVTKVWVDRVDDPKTGRPIGSGPFLVTRLERGKQITLVRNPRYWGLHVAYLDRLVQRFMTPDPQDPLAPVRDGVVDFGFNLGGQGVLSSDDAREIRARPGWRTTAWPGSAMEHVVFRVGPGGHPALKSKLVRQALAFGIDRVAIARAIQLDVPVSLRRPMDSTVFLPTEPSYRPNWNRYRYDVPRSRRLLERAGCRRGVDGIYACAGERLRLRFVTTADAPDREHILELAATQLREVGVDVAVQYAPSKVFIEQILPGGNFDVALFSWLGVAGGVAVWPDALCGDHENFGGYCSRLVQRDAGQNLIGSLAVRARVLNRLDTKLAKAAPVLPIVQPVVRAFYRSNLRGVSFGGSHFEVQEDTENWWLAPER